MSDVVGDPKPTGVDAKPVPALVRFSAIMDALSGDTRPRGVSELARELTLPRCTVHGLCRTLAGVGVLSRVNATDFTIGPHVLSWANAFGRQNRMVRQFVSLAESMERHEGLSLAVLAGRDVMYLSVHKGNDPLAVRFSEGLRFPAPYTASGKAILSTYTADEVVALMGDDWPEPPSSRSVRDIHALLRELDETRERGYSVDNGQMRPSLLSCGAPVFGDDPHGHAVAGVAMGMISPHATDASVRRTGEEIIAFAREVSRGLGAGLS